MAVACTAAFVDLAAPCAVLIPVKIYMLLISVMQLLKSNCSLCIKLLMKSDWSKLGINKARIKISKRGRLKIESPNNCVFLWSESWTKKPYL